MAESPSRAAEKRKAGTTPDELQHVLVRHYECPICMETLYNAVILPKCGHSFCKECIDRLQTVSGKVSNLCPVCRAPFHAAIRNRDADTVIAELARLCPDVGGSHVKRLEELAKFENWKKEHPTSGSLGMRATAYLAFGDVTSPTLNEVWQDILRKSTAKLSGKYRLHAFSVLGLTPESVRRLPVPTVKTIARNLGLATRGAKLTTVKRVLTYMHG